MAPTAKAVGAFRLFVILLRMKRILRRVARLKSQRLSEWMFLLQARMKRSTRAKGWQRVANHFKPTLPLDRPVDFVIAGVQKGGTSALAHYLEMHPRIAGAWMKEVHYFDDDALFLRGASHSSVYHAYFADRGQDVLYGEATPRYLVHPHAIQRMAAYNQRLKVIVILRNPVERAFSQWNMYNRGADSTHFRKVVEEEINRLAQGDDRLYPGYVARGHYADQLKRLFGAFPQSQVLCLKYEDYLADNARAVAQTLDFLDVEPQPIEAIKKRHVIPYNESIAAVDRAFLVAHFEPQIAWVERELGWDCSDWRKV